MKKLEALLNLIIRIVIGLFGILIISFPILLLIQGKDFAGREIESGSFVGIIFLGCLAGIFFLAFAIRGSKPKNTTKLRLGHANLAARGHRGVPSRLQTGRYEATFSM